MLYKTIILLAAGFIAGILLSFVYSAPLLLSLLCILTGLAATAYILYYQSRWREVPFLLTAIAVLMVSIPLGTLRMHPSLHNPVKHSLSRYLNNENRDSEEYKLRCTVSAEPELRHDSLISLRCTTQSILNSNTGTWREIQPAEILILVANTEEKSPLFLELSDSDAYGYTLELTARETSITRNRNPETFDYLTYAKQDNIAALFQTRIHNIHIRDRGSTSLYRKSTYSAKKRILGVFRNTIPSPSSRILAAALFGTQRALHGVTFNNEPLQEIFRQAGIDQLLAGSGLHLCILSLLLYLFFISLGYRTSRSAPAIIVLLILYTLVTGARPSTLLGLLLNTTILGVLVFFQYSLRKSVSIGLAASSIFVLLINPYLLFSSIFFLLFATVICIVFLGPVISRWMLELRGVTLIFVVTYLLILLFIAHYNIVIFMQLPTLLTIGALLWILIRLGRIINNRFPFMWKFAYRGQPQILRALIAVQLAVLIGMIIPLNAWFTGHFPVAAAVIYIPAIPLVGLSVLFGFITGLIGLIPVAGTTLALPFGMLSHACVKLLLFITETAASFFSYPALPAPSLWWLCTYVGCIVVLISFDTLYPYYQTALYKTNNLFKSRIFRYIPALIALVMLVIPALINVFLPVTPRMMVVYNTRQNPVVSLSFSDRTAVVFNVDEDLYRGNTLFKGIRYSKAALLRALILSSAGTGTREAVSDFAGTIQVKTLYLPRKREKDGIRLHDDIPTRYINFFNVSEAVSFSYLRAGDERDNTGTPPIAIDSGKSRALLIPDYTNNRIPEADSEIFGSVDIMICPHIANQEEYRYVINAVQNIQPGTLVIVNGRSDKSELSPDTIPGESGRDLPVISTHREGAAVIRYFQDSIVLETRISKRREILRRFASP